LYGVLVGVRSTSHGQGYFGHILGRTPKNIGWQK
jgi:hypothetical protein